MRNLGTFGKFSKIFLFNLKTGFDEREVLSNGDLDSYKFWILVGIIILFDFAKSSMEQIASKKNLQFFILSKKFIEFLDFTV